MKQRIRLTESDLHRVVKESVKRVLNEVGDTTRGQYMLGRLAAKKNADNYYNYPYENGIIAPEQARMREVGRISDYADKHGDDSFSQRYAYMQGYDNYNQDNRLGNVKTKYNRYKKRDNNPIFKIVGDLNDRIKNIYKNNL